MKIRRSWTLFGRTIYLDVTTDPVDYFIFVSVQIQGKKYRYKNSWEVYPR